MALTDKLSNIASAIRSKTGSAAKLKLDEMPSAIEGITTGGGNSELFKAIIGRTVTAITAEDLAGVTSIGELIFASCKKLTAVTLPEGLERIGDDAFHNSGVKSIVIPDSVESLHTSCFQRCEQLETAHIGNGVNNWFNSVFYLCKKLSEVTFGENCKISTIPGSTFHGCEALSKIILPHTITKIGDSAFRGCSSLTSLVIPEGVTAISDAAFCETGLTSIVIPDGVKELLNLTFGYCSSLASVTIPASTTFIQSHAFNECNALTDVYYKGTEEQWNTINIMNAGNNSLINATIHFNS
jgi:hypothetical protein